MSERLRPACRNPGPHPAHEYDAGYRELSRCPGWTVEEAGASAMLDALDEAMRPYEKPLAYFDPPDGLRVECHPLVLHELRRIIMPSFADIRAHGEPHDDRLLPVPLVVVPGMERGAWRLVLTQGVIGGE